MNTPHSTVDSPEILFHLRWVAKIALLIGALAATGLVLMLYVLTDATGETYSALIESHSVAQYRLGWALLIGGFFLLAFSAILTWLITLYSSFRIAGPLFRLARNLATSVSQDPVKPIPIRVSDRLQAESAMLEGALGGLQSHYGAMRKEIDQALAQLDTNGLDTTARRDVIDRLQAKLDSVRV